MGALRRAHAPSNLVVHPHLLAAPYLQSGVSANCRPGENSPARANRIVPAGTMSEAISLRTPSLRTKARKVVKQIERSRSPDPIMRRPCADREEKRGPAGTTHPETETGINQEQLDRNDPNQRRLSDNKALDIIDRHAAFASAACSWVSRAIT